MGLLDRVALLIRANLNDLIDRAEDPEKLVKQIILDMQNQSMQVKTQVAIAMADAHQLQARIADNRTAGQEWLEKAKTAVSKGRDDLARAAIEKALGHQETARKYTEQYNDQQLHVEQLRSALQKLEARLAEAMARRELLIAQRRSARASRRSHAAVAGLDGEAPSAAFDRMKNKVEHEAAVSAAMTELAGHDLRDEFASLTRNEEVERILQDLRCMRDNNGDE